MTPGAPVNRHRSYGAVGVGDVLGVNLLDVVTGRNRDGVAGSATQRVRLGLSLA